jgi:hypothetical protein
VTDAIAGGGIQAMGGADKKAAQESNSKWLRGLLTICLAVFAIGVGLYFSYPGPGGASAGWLFLSGFALVIGLLAYLNLRAERLGTLRARKQSDAAEMIFEWLMTAGHAVAVGVLLLVLGLVVYGWIAGHFWQPPYMFVTLLVVWVFNHTIFWSVLDWIKDRANIAGLVFALMALGVLLAAHAAAVFYFAWHTMPEAPLWSIILLPTVLFLGVGWSLVWGIALAVGRLHALLASSPTRAK